MSLGKTLFCGFAIVMGASSVGCTVQTGGQTLPSPYYLTDDVQYFAPGPEFYLQNEAAAMQLKKAEAEAQRAGQRRR
jgi:hypothetical protein